MGKPITSQAVYYIRYDDGSLSKLVIDSDADSDAEPAPPAGGTFITEDEYNAEMVLLQQAIEEHAEQIRQQEQQQAKTDYEALIAAGLPDAVAQRLAGYTPPEPEPEPEVDVPNEGAA
ncbi:hypothetical protein DIZ27_32905 [Streptomyces sp. NWU339]|uniref:hypothetical protein n=1 Tax=Streptomyces sp. NWU339 TaxID=2185284 RepID=UPI000D67E279|nr:hypothetical protein [Streptomyces sp. NWU339]PWI06541.1 hypothetical protein DIZ27_32905 [Streptomyces sp. NWU339]